MTKVKRPAANTGKNPKRKAPNHQEKFENLLDLAAKSTGSAHPTERLAKQKRV
jgi:hypothetical protein